MRVMAYMKRHLLENNEYTSKVDMKDYQSGKHVSQCLDLLNYMLMVNVLTSFHTIELSYYRNSILGDINDRNMVLITMSRPPACTHYILTTKPAEALSQSNTTPFHNVLLSKPDILA